LSSVEASLEWDKWQTWLLLDDGRECS